jgi:protein-disulfide isomerase
MDIPQMEEMNNKKPQKKEGGTVTLKKSSLWKAGALVFAGLFLLSLFTGGFGFGSDSPSGAAVAPTAGPPGAAPAGNVKLSIADDDPVLGDRKAPITVFEFSDFECPFCSRAFNGAVAELKGSELFTSGKVNFVYKHLPLTSIHPNAQKAAEASECANRQDKFWEYHDTLFQNQGDLSIGALKSHAASLGLNTAEFNKCLDSNEARGKVSADSAAASAAGARGTPYFLIVNSKGQSQAVSGAVPFGNIEGAIKSLQ